VASRLILSRLGLALLTLLGVSMFIFWTTEVLPGDIAARVLGRQATAEAKQAFRDELNLDRPVHERYALWLGGALKGDFGTSLVNGRPVTDAVIPRLRNTLILAGYAFILYVPVSLLLAIVAALYRDRTPDAIVSALNLLGLALPEFVLGTLLIYVFAIHFPVFPVMSLIHKAETLPELLRMTTLPALTLMTAMAVYSIRMLRDNLIEVLQSEYIGMCRLKGLSPWRIVLLHALPNAAIPALNTMALNLTYLIGGVVVVEQVFAYQGLGSLLVESVFLRDAPVIEAVALMSSALYIVANLGADLLAILLNPRLRSR